MNIQMEDIVSDYVYLTIASLDPLQSLTVESLQERLVMTILESGVAMGLIEHEYHGTKSHDVFKSTSRLAEYWPVIFPGQNELPPFMEDVVLELRGRRAKYFNSNWLSGRTRADAEATWRKIVKDRKRAKRLN